MAAIGKILKSAFVSATFTVASLANAATVSPISTINVTGGSNLNITTTATTPYSTNYFYELVVGAYDAFTTFTLSGTTSTTVPVRYFLWEDTNSNIGAGSIAAIGNSNTAVDPGVLVETVPYLTVGQSFQYALQADKQYILQIQKTASGWDTITTNVSAVPLPGAIWMFGTALLGFLGFSSRRKV